MADQVDSDWIEWEGGKCPLPDGVTHEVRFRDGITLHDDCPETWTWRHHGSGCDIIAYRVVSA